jgi:hypothetical protein
LRHGPAPLHFIGRLAAIHLPILAKVKPPLDLPLLYGLRFSGCHMSYSLGSGRDPAHIKLTAITPRRSVPDWPYEHYPVLLPYIPLRVSRPHHLSYRAFANRYDNMSVKQPAPLIVTVPPPFDIGLSLWGPMGDAENVTMVFECNLAARIVTAYNVCT